MPATNAVDEERLRDVAVHADDRLAVLLRQHARPIGEREQQVVPLRQEANGRGGFGVRQRRARDVEQLAAVLVAKAAQRLEPIERRARSRARASCSTRRCRGATQARTRRGSDGGSRRAPRAGRAPPARRSRRTAPRAARARAPSRGGAGRARATRAARQARRASMPVSPCSRSRWASASAVVTGPPRRAPAPTARVASRRRDCQGSSSRSAPRGGARSRAA